MVLRCRRFLAAIAAVAVTATLGLPPLLAAGETRTIALHNIHTKDTVEVIYKRDGKFVPEGLEKASWVLRDWRRNEATRMEPELIDLLWEMHRELGSKEPIHVISGYRSRSTNDMLRKTVGGQASESRHILGKAADVHFPDIPIRLMRYSAMVRERGGVGYYPTSAIPFIHVDTDRVRAWPRLPRLELALLFPSGHTKHQAADGGSISKEDVRLAQTQHRELATQMAAFLDARASRRPMAVAALATPPPRAALTASASGPVAAIPATPTPVGKAAPGKAPAEVDRAGLTALFGRAAAEDEPRLVKEPTLVSRRKAAPPAMASLTGAPPAGIIEPKAPASAPEPARVAAAHPAAGLAPAATLTDAGRGSTGPGWVRAPDFDDEHPDELSYRPFPILPLLTATATEPFLAELVHPDTERTLELLDKPDATLPLRLRPGAQLAAMMWSDKFTGDAVNLTRLSELQAPAPTPATRRVKTSEKK